MARGFEFDRRQFLAVAAGAAAWLYETKYAGEFDRWRDEMRSGFHSGERVLIRYEPL